MQAVDTSKDAIYEAKWLDLLRRLVLMLTEGLPCNVFLFGSRAEGNYRRDSDYDVGVIGLSDEQFRELRFLLNGFLESSIIPHKLDLVNFDQVRDEFKKVALEKTILWKNV